MIVKINGLVVRREAHPKFAKQTIFLLIKLHFWLYRCQKYTWHELENRVLAEVHIKKDNLKINPDPPVTFIVIIIEINTINKCWYIKFYFPYPFHFLHEI